MGSSSFPIIQKLLEPIFILIVLLSVLPILYEWLKRRRAAKRAGLAAGEPTPEQI
jgi:membrane-associated protein